MGLSNSEVLENLLKQRVEIEQQLETLRTTYLKFLVRLMHSLKLKSQMLKLKKNPKKKSKNEFF